MKMNKQKNNKMKLTTIIVVGIIILAVFLYAQIVWAKSDPIDFSWGAVFGILSALLTFVIKQEHQKIK